MNIKGVLILVIVTSILISSVCAAGVNDFKVDSSFKNVYSSEYYAVYATNDQTSGISIYKNENDDVYDDQYNDDVLDGAIHHDGREYTYGDDMKVDKKADNTANFTDYEHATHGITEVVSHGGAQYIVVFWAKDTSNANLASQLSTFNKNNGVIPVAF